MRLKHYHVGERIMLLEGKADQYDGGPPDLVLTNPYGPLPPVVLEVPMLVHQWVHRKAELEAWTRSPASALRMVSTWNDDREAVWSINFPHEFIVDLRDLRPEAGGWWPLELPRRLLAAYGHADIVVWDGFCGRATGGQAALDAGMRYIGIDERIEALDEARAFLRLPEDER